MEGKVVITEGIIGVGKTTFSEALAKSLRAKWMREPDEEEGNPYLKQFYEEPERWAFTMQMHLLNIRYRMHVHAQWCALQTNTNVVLDRSYFGDTAFANLQREMNTMSIEEFNTYTMSYHNMTSSVLLPQVCILLEVDVEKAQERVMKRMEKQTGRKCEECISHKYLVDLKRHEAEMINALKAQGVCIIKLDWNEDKSPEDIQRKAEEIANTINSLPKHLFLDYHRRTI